MKGDITAGGKIKTVLATDNNVPRVRARSLPRQPGCAARIALIDVDGLLVNRNLSGSGSMGENPVAFFREKLEAAEADPCVQAVVLRINSPGGGVTACDIMREDLQRFRQRTGKPIVASLMDLGAGGAYYLASACDAIYAHPTTLTGGLGVILNRYDITDAMGQQNVFAEPIRSGKKIDMGSPAREIEEEEKEILEQIAKQYHQRLRIAVSDARPKLSTRLPEPLAPPRQADEQADSPGDTDQPRDGSLFDGRVLLASDALQHGMIDQLGYLDDAIAAARAMAGLGQSNTIMYRRNNDRALTAYDITPNLPTPTVSVPLSIPGLDRSQLPVYLYLWQPEPLLERTGGL